MIVQGEGKREKSVEANLAIPYGRFANRPCLWVLGVASKIRRGATSLREFCLAGHPFLVIAEIGR